jgi:hypothetical protein
MRNEKDRDDNKSRMGINLHGILGLAAIVAMLGICHYLEWKVPWLYIVTAVVLYAVAVLLLSDAYEQKCRSYDPEEAVDFLRLLLGSHLAFGLLALGVLLDLSGFWTNTAIFITSVAIGITIPFLLIRKK